MRPELTIAIPTYNRAEELRGCLKRVFEYSKRKSIEILVSDNASSDNTMEVVKELQEIHPEMLYFRNDENLGFDGNFLNCFERASGKYIWLLSDDDILLPGAIESVLEGCKINPVCMHLNSSGIESDTPFVLTKPRFKEQGFIEHKDKNSLIESIGIYCTFVSSLVFNVDMVREIPDKEQYFKTNILQSHIFFEIMKNEGLYIIDTYNCLAARGNPTVHYDVLNTWVKNYSELLITTAIKCGFDEKRMSEVLRIGLDTTVYNFVVSFRQTCKNEKSWDRDCIWPYIERYPELVDRYKKAVYCPVNDLKWMEFKTKVSRTLRRLIWK